MVNIYDILAESVSNFPDNIFYSDECQGGITYLNFLEIVHTKGVVFDSRRLSRYEVVVILDDDPLTMLAEMFAIWSRGAIPCVLHPHITNEDMKHLIEFIRPKLVKIRGSMEIFEQGGIIEQADLNPALITFSTGTSNQPKAILHSHQAIIENAKLINGYLHLSSFDRCLNLKSLHQVASLSSLILPSILVGAEVHFVKKTMLFAIAEYINKHQITFIDAVATVVRYITSFNVQNHFSESPLRIISINGEHMSENDLSCVVRAFPNAKVFYSYGLSEAGPRVTYLEDCHFLNKKGSVGIALDKVTIKIVEMDHQDLINYSGEYAIGEIAVKSPSIMLGYFNNKERTERTIVDGYLYTGDVGFIDNEGYLYVLGRKDETIIRGGQNIYPYEIEDFIKKIPSILDCVVIGIEDMDHGQKVVAFITSNTLIHQQEIMRHCVTHLPKYLVPQDIILIDDIPKKMEN